MSTIYGDGDPNNPDIFATQHGKHQTLTGVDNQDNTILGDVDTFIIKAKGGNDHVVGGNVDTSVAGLIENHLAGDANRMFQASWGGNDLIEGGNVSGTAPARLINLMAGDALESMNQDARGGNDILIGGSNSSSSGSSVANAIAGDSFDMNFFAHGGNDSLVGGNNYGSGDVVNNMTGDAFSMGGTGGNDTIAGGNNYGSGGVSNMMFGDSRTAMLADQQAGDDVLIAGIGLNVNNFMFGDALGGANFPGQDTFIFEDDKKTGLTVGTQNAIGDFQQGLDVIKFIGSLRMSKNSATLVSRPRRLAPIPTPSS